MQEPGLGIITIGQMEFVKQTSLYHMHYVDVVNEWVEEGKDW